MSTKQTNEARRSALVVVDERSIKSLLKEHIPHILRSLEADGLDRYKKDIVQDAFLALWDIRDRTAFTDVRAYLFIIIRNLKKKYYKQKNSDKTRVNLDTTVPDSILCQRFIATDTDFDLEVQAENNRKLNRVLDLMEIHLDDKQYRILKQRLFERKKFKEIATTENQSEDTVRQIAHRAKRKIKNLF